MKSFPSIHTKRIDTKAINDLLGLGLDANVMELVHLFQAMGFETTASCGGHENRTYNPYIHFQGDQLEKIVSLLLSWQKAGGMKYGISHLGLVANEIGIEGLPGPNLKARQQDLDNLTDFVNERTGGLPLTQLSFTEIAHQVRRKLRKKVKKFLDSSFFI